MTVLFYIFIIIFGFIIPLIVALTAFSNIFTNIMGAPFVPTSKKLVEEILGGANLKKDQIFYELGSGDGRLVIEAVKKYQVKGIGIEIHPLLIYYSRFLANLLHLNNIYFRNQNMFKVDLTDADVVCMFLFPNAIQRLAKKIIVQCKIGTVIISHGFKIKALERCLVKVQARNSFPTYFYRLNKATKKYI